ncbi:MAG: cytochrome b, partial [Pseudomonadota bacterium]
MTTTHAPPFRASRYTTGAIVLHWAIALLILAQIAGGYAMVEFLRTGSALQYDVFQLHKSLGVAVLILTVARILWRLFNPPPPEPASVNALERTVSHIVHMAFYALLLLIPLSGWFLITVSPIQIETVLFFTDWLPWPHIPGFAALPEAARENLA